MSHPALMGRSQPKFKCCFAAIFLCLNQKKPGNCPAILCGKKQVSMPLFRQCFSHFPRNERVKRMLKATRGKKTAATRPGKGRQRRPGMPVNRRRAQATPPGTRYDGPRKRKLLLFHTAILAAGLACIFAAGGAGFAFGFTALFAGVAGKSGSGKGGKGEKGQNGFHKFGFNKGSMSLQRICDPAAGASARHGRLARPEKRNGKRLSALTMSPDSWPLLFTVQETGGGVCTDAFVHAGMNHQPR